MFSRNTVRWARQPKACGARLTRIDPIQVWINAERILIVFLRNTKAGAAGSRPQLLAWTTMP
jgi:hypothetical protein